MVPEEEGDEAATPDGEADTTLDATLEEVVARVGAADDLDRGQSAKRLVSGTLYASSSTARPTCARCRRPWRWPRNIAHTTMVCDVPERIKPTTKATVVAHLTAVPGSFPPKPTICEKVFRRLELLHTPEGFIRFLRNRITRQFLYHTESGYVSYDVSKQQDSGFAFARLITLNSWYVALFKCLMIAMLSVLDHHANFLLVVQLFADPNDPLVVDFGWARYPFAVGWMIMLLLALLVAGHSAWIEWRIKVGPRVGDLIPQCGLLDITLTFAAMTCFAFFSVEQQVKDIVIVLHPWKSIQPYAAFKSDGVRAYCVGYMDEYLFQVENLPGFYSLFAQLLMRTFVFVFKTYRLVLSSSPVLVVNVVSSVGSVCFGWRSWLELVQARRRLKVRLLQIVRDRRSGEEATEHWRRQRDAAKKLLSLHFSFSARQHLDEPRTRVASPAAVATHECPRCGRDHDPSRSEETSMQAPRVEVGEKVRLSASYRKFHDAKYGPLRPGQIGTVLETGPWIPICGARSLVSTSDGDEIRTWWYDQGAVEPSTPEPFASTDTLLKDLVPETPGTIASNDDELSEELRNLVGRLLREPPERRRRHATELLRAAEALAGDPGGGADVLRIPSSDVGDAKVHPEGHEEAQKKDERVLEVLPKMPSSQTLPGAVKEDSTN